jgi:hypothetical protein
MAGWGQAVMSNSGGISSLNSTRASCIPRVEYFHFNDFNWIRLSMVCAGGLDEELAR